MAIAVKLLFQFIMKIVCTVLLLPDVAYAVGRTRYFVITKPAADGSQAILYFQEKKERTGVPAGLLH